MIQRAQTIWLLLAAALNSGTIFFDLYRYHTVVNGVDTLQTLKSTAHYPTLLVALVITILPLVTVFMYSNRKRQLSMTVACLTSIGGFIALALGHINSVISKITPAPTAGSYWIGSVIPVAALIMVVLAIIGIRKDEKLVRSMDRLR